MLLSGSVRAARLQGRAHRRRRRRGVRRLRPVQGSQGAPLLGATARTRSGGRACSNACTAISRIRRCASPRSRSRSSARAWSISTGPCSPTCRAGRPRSARCPCLSPELRASLRDWDPLDAYERTLPPGIMSWSPLARDQYVEAKTLLAGYLLSSQGDRVAMANSIEGRFPYLDHRLIEFASTPAAQLQDPRPEREVPVAARTRRPAAAGHPRTHQAALPRAGQPLLLRRRQAAGLRGRADESPNASARRASSTPVPSAGCSRNAAAGRATGFADNQAFVGVLSTMLLQRQVRGWRRPVQCRALTREPATEAYV